MEYNQTQSHYNNVDCPYCGKNSQAEIEDWPWKENEKEQMYCYFCNNYFTVTLTDITYTLEVTKNEEADPSEDTKEVG